jgi:large subunit ribosomal protein L9
MDVILIQDTDTLGEHGDVVKVSSGYARNYLFPRKLAIVATPGALKDLEARRSQLQRKAEKRHQENLRRAEILDNMEPIIITAQAGEGGKLFGTITPKDLAQALEVKAGMVIDRKNLLLTQPLNHLGQFEVGVRLSARVKATFQVEVAAQEAPLA